MRLFFILICLACLSGCIPETAHRKLTENKINNTLWLTVDRAMDSYMKNEGWALSGYTYRNRERTLRIKVGEISKDLLYTHLSTPEEPGDYFRGMTAEEIKDEGMIFGLIFEKDF